MDITRLNHFVPRRYQKNFYKPGGKNFWIYDKSDPTRDPRSGHASNTLAINDLYTLEERNGAQTDKLEKFFTQIETSANHIFNRIVNEEIYPTDMDRQILAEYLAYQHVRVPRHIDQMTKFFKALVLEISNNIVRDPVTAVRLKLEG
jgi:hypothetical protein